MKKIYVKVSGMTCETCKEKVINSLLKINNIKKINFDGNIAEIKYQKILDMDKIEQTILNIGYYTDKYMISEKKKPLTKNIKLIEFIKILTIIILVIFIINNAFGFNILNTIPAVNENITLGMLFLTGLLTSIHCVSMCGAINLMATKTITKNFKKPILYNLGRLVSYTVIGGLVGLLGSVFTINSYFQGIIIIFSAIIMLLMVLNMLGIINVSFKFKKPKLFNKISKNSSFVIGLLNGLMPCGPLQAMQVYALSTGSVFYGALSMFLFCLGTIPLMLFVGMLSNFLNNKKRIILNKFASVLMLVLSLAMLNRGILSMGFDIFIIFKPNYDSYLKSEIKEDYQLVEFDLKYSGYEDIIIQKDIPVKIIINVTDKTLTGCNNAIKINNYNIYKKLEIGKNIIEFTPKKEGTFIYTCWMNMLKNNIVVVEDISAFKI